MLSHYPKIPDTGIKILELLDTFQQKIWLLREQQKFSFVSVCNTQIEDSFLEFFEINMYKNNLPEQSATIFWGKKNKFGLF